MPFVEHQLHAALLAEMRAESAANNCVAHVRTHFALIDTALVVVLNGRAMAVRPLAHIPDAKVGSLID